MTSQRAIVTLDNFHCQFCYVNMIIMFSMQAVIMQAVFVNMNDTLPDWSIKTRNLVQVLNLVLLFAVEYSTLIENLRYKYFEICADFDTITNNLAFLCDIKTLQLC